MKKLRALLAASCTIILCLLLLAGCAGNSGTEGSASTQGSKGPLANDAIKENQIDWTANNAVENGERRVGFAYTNMSKYDISELGMTFKLKPDVSFDEFKSVFTDPATTNEVMIQAVDQLTEENYLTKVEAQATVRTLTSTGSTSESDYLAAGYLYLTNMAQLELFAPNMMTISYVSDGKIYRETYDFVTQSYSLSKDTITLADWPDSELAQMLPTPDQMLLEEASEKDGELTFETIGTSKDTFEEYIGACKEAGFMSGGSRSSSSTSYDANNADNTYKLHLYLNDLFGELRGSLTPVA